MGVRAFAPEPDADEPVFGCTDMGPWDGAGAVFGGDMGCERSVVVEFVSPNAVLLLVVASKFPLLLCLRSLDRICSTS